MAEEYDSEEGLPEEVEEFIEEEGDRGDAALMLHRSGLIDREEMVLLLQWTDDDDPASQIYALAIGEFRISKHEMAKNTSLTKTQLASIEEEMKGHSEWFKNLGGNITAPFRAAGAAGVGVWDWVQEGREESKEKDRIREALEDALDALPAEYVTEGQRDELKGLLSGKQMLEVIAPHFDEVRELLDDETREYVEMAINEPSNWTTPEDAEQYSTDPLTPEQVRAKKLEGGEPVVGGYMPPIKAPAVTPAPQQTYPPGSFGEYLSQSGLVAATPERLPVDIAPVGVGIDSPIPGDFAGDYFYDKATGEYYSQQEYQRILEGQAMYAANYAPGAAVAVVGDEVLGGGRLGEYFRAREAGPNLAHPHIRGAYNMGGPLSASTTGDSRTWSLGSMPKYMRDSIQIASLFPDEPWEKAAFDWQPGSAVAFLDTMTATEKRRWENQLRDQGLLTVRDDQGRAYFEADNQAGYLQAMTEQVLGVSRGKQVSPWSAATHLGNYVDEVATRQQALLQHTEAMAAAMTPKKLPFEIPANLREVPDYKTIAQDAKAMFRQKVGRDPTAVDLSRISDDLTGYHRRRNEQLIKLAYEHWEGGNDDILDPDMEEVVNPAGSLAYDIETDWASEIDLTKRRATNAKSHRDILRATMGSGVSQSVVSGTNVVR